MQWPLTMVLTLVKQHMIRHIRAGKLNIQLTCGHERFDELMALASRENHKRGFLFVSRVLGKHIPVRPSTMRAIYDTLAEKCKITKNTFVMGMAETATGLGAGIADSLARQHPYHEVYYQHTTRHHLPNHAIWFAIKESHSHAVDHLIYEPSGPVRAGLDHCEQLILVDDEATTGNTLLQLAEQTLKKLPKLQKLQIVTLANWLTPHRRAAFAKLSIPVEFVQLMQGTFEFEPKTNHQVQTPETVDNDLCHLAARADLGRTGMKMPYTLTVADLEHRDEHQGQTNSAHSDPIPHHQHSRATDKKVVIGTGEHLYLPFLIAEQLEHQGTDVLFQSTTRSPILLGDAIARKTRFFVRNQKENYIYNLPKNRQQLILVETEAHAAHHGLLNGQSREANAN